MKISHEVPLNLLEQSTKFNDYHYFLPHFRKYNEYMKFFKDKSNRNEFIIMDNGLFEGEIPTDKELISLINEIKPDIFIIPDEWDNHLQSAATAKKWMSFYKNGIFPYKTKMMGVLQGQDQYDLLTCYDLYRGLDIKHISINHSSMAFYRLGGNEYNPFNKMVGRKKFLNILNEYEGFDPNLYYHLLGVNLTQEGWFCKEFSFINSIDTSNPIIYGLTKGRYPDDLRGIKTKPKQKLEEFFEIEINEETELDILYNILQFKKSING